MSILVELAKYPNLETERLVLRSMTKDDLEDYTLRKSKADVVDLI
ncbi:hypothetical protein [Streptococcus thoraltensis]|nr:hypothetical protein [Streptococcus thoraltensis]